MPKKKTHEKYMDQINEKHLGKINVIGKYVNDFTKILHKCSGCETEWYVAPSNILRGTGCPTCSRIRADKLRKHTNEEYINRLFKKHGDNIKSLEKYNGIHIKIMHECKICGHKWNVLPSSLLSGAGCPICAIKRGCLLRTKPNKKTRIILLKGKVIRIYRITNKIAFITKNLIMKNLLKNIKINLIPI